MKIVIVIGQSAAGKSTFVVSEYMKEDAKVIDKPFKHTETHNICLLGDYLAERRCVGTDTLSMAVLPQLIEFIKENKDRYEIIVAEGDRINNKRFFEFVASLGVPIELYVFSCSLEESIKRREETGSNSSETFVKTTITKSNNMKQLGKKLGFNLKEIYTGKEKEKNIFDF